ncbi:hypothetical protein RUND412_005340 [Rhizina undulata]
MVIAFIAQLIAEQNPVTLLGGSLFVYLLGFFIYRIFFHPLAKYPGPFLAKITGLYGLYRVWKGDRYIVNYKAHLKYGEFVRIGPNLLSSNSKEALKEIYGVNKNVQKSEEFYRAFAGHPTNYTRNTLNVTNKQIHASRRKVLAHAFTETALKSMEPYFLPEIENLCNIIATWEQSLPIPGSDKEKSGKWRGDMGKWANYLTFDIMGELSFGKGFGMLYEETNRRTPDLIVDHTTMALMCATFPLLDKWRLDSFLFRKIAKNQRAFRKYAEENGEKRINMGVDRKDFFGCLLSARELDKSAYSMNELLAESRLLIIAGSDTTATLIAGSMLYLTRNPSIKEKLMAEVRSTFNSLDDIRLGKTIDSCHYLKACIEETLRMSPSAPGILQRVVLPGGLRIGDTFIPPGVEVGVASYSIHRNPKYFEDPLTYRPERWLKEDGNGLDLNMYGAFAPFSIGSRGCIGKRVAYIEAELTLARLMWAFEAKYVSGGVEDRIPNDEYMLVDHFSAQRDGPVVEFEKRINVVF